MKLLRRNQFESEVLPRLCACGCGVELWPPPDGKHFHIDGKEVTQLCFQRYVRNRPDGHFGAGMCLCSDDDDDEEEC